MDPVIEFKQLGSTPFKRPHQWRRLLNGVDLSCMNSITGSDFIEKCSNILHDITAKFREQSKARLILGIKKTFKFETMG